MAGRQAGRQVDKRRQPALRGRGQEEGRDGDSHTYVVSCSGHRQYASGYVACWVSRIERGRSEWTSP